MTALRNLQISRGAALCNNFKGSDVAAYVPETDELVRLFNPRLDAWAEHFEWNGPALFGKTDAAKATVALLRINAQSRVALRQMLMDEGVFRLKSDSENSLRPFIQHELLATQSAQQRLHIVR